MTRSERPPPDPRFIHGLVLGLLVLAIGFGIYWFFR